VDLAASFVDVHKVYRGSPFDRNGIQAVRGLSLKIPKGCVFGLLGPNRSGKTTLMKMLLGLCSPTSGKIERLGQPLQASTLQKTGYLHENQHFPKYLTARQILDMYGSLSCVAHEKVLERIPLLLKRVGIADRADEPISRFSKGMVQRVALAQAILNEPELLVLDEPSEGLDLLGRQLLASIIQERKAAGGTVILVSHVLPETEKLVDHVAVLTNGELKRQGPIADWLKNDAGQQITLEAALAPIYQGAAP
jgi:ABC-2 type transport system ATP-binding protein